MITLFIGIVIGVVVTGFIAHRWPSFFAKQVDQGAAAVNQAIDATKKN